MEKLNYQFKLENIYGFFAKSENVVLGSLFLFVVFLMAQHSMVFLYHDDWGVSVLHYVGKQTGFKGQEFSFSHVIDFLWGMYNRWSGRVVSIFSHIYLEKAGIWYVRLWQVIAIFFTVLLAYKIAIKALGTNNKGYLLIFSIVLYLAMPARALINGIYWFSAASGYLWCMPFFLLGVYLFSKTDKVTFSPYVLLAFSATFHELMGVAVVAFLLSNILLNIKDFVFKRIAYSFLPMIAAMVTVLAPGNFARKKVSNYGDQDVYSLVVGNFNTMVDRLFSPELFGIKNAFFAFIAFSFFSMLWKLMPEKINLRYKIIAIASTILFFTLIYTALPSAFFGIIFIISYTVLFVLSCMQRTHAKLILSLYISSFSVLLPLLFAPGVAWRTEVIFLVLMFAPILFSIGLLDTKNEIVFRNTFISVALLFGCYNSYHMFMGYKENYNSNQANHFILMAVSDSLERKIDVGDKVLLFKLPKPYYAGKMPYERPLIETWMKKYYSLPESIVFEWK